MKAEQFLKQLDNTITTIESGLEKAMETMALTALAKIEQRILEKGLDARLRALKPYSPGWLEKKTAKKHYVGHVNLKDENHMWPSIGIVEQKNDKNGKYDVVIKARDETEQEKVNRNAALRGDFLALSKQEKTDVLGDFKEDVLNIIKKSVGKK